MKEENSLYDKAIAEWYTLTTLEAALIDDPAGVLAIDALEPHGPSEPPSTDEDRTVRLEFLFWLLEQRSVQELSRFRSLDLKNAFVKAAHLGRPRSIPYDLSFIDCEFLDSCVMDGLHVGAIRLRSCRVERLSMKSAVVDGEFASIDCKFEHSCTLDGLTAKQIYLHNCSAERLSIEAAKIEGDLFVTGCSIAHVTMERSRVTKDIWSMPCGTGCTPSPSMWTA